MIFRWVSFYCFCFLYDPILLHTQIKFFTISGLQHLTVLQHLRFVLIDCLSAVVSLSAVVCLSAVVQKQNEIWFLCDRQSIKEKNQGNQTQPLKKLKFEIWFLFESKSKEKEN